MQTPPHSTQSDALAALLDKSKRLHSVPIRKTFVQQKEKGRALPGPLHLLVQRHDRYALDLYLLVLLVAVAPPYVATIEAGGWARALGLSSANRRTTVSRSWKRLADLQLVARKREGRRASITLLKEDGSGRAYSRPGGGSEVGERYLKLPLEYWSQQWCTRLTLSAKAMLLVALSLPDGFSLPLDRTPAWYGLSGDTAGRGFSELERAGLLQHQDLYKKAPLTAQGWALDRRYTLQEPFNPHEMARTEVLREDGLVAL